MMTIKKSIRQKLRSSFLWLHRWLGLISGIVVFIVSITGCIYVFEEECRNLFQHKYYYVSPQDAKKPLEQLTEAVVKQYPRDTITQIRFKEQVDAAVIYHTKKGKIISINPYTAQIIGERTMKKDFFAWIVILHVNLHMGKIGSEIIKWNVLIFFILCVTGLIIWWPKQKKYFRQALSILWKTKNKKRLNWDLHSVLGFYSLLVLLMVSLTGIFWMFDWAKTFTAFATHSKETNTKAPLNKGDSSLPVFAMETAYTTARQLHPGASETFILRPLQTDQPIRVLFRYPYTIVRKQNTLFFDKYTGKVLREDLYKNYTTYDKLMRSNFDFHTGRIRILGIGSKILYFLASLFAASLPITGIIIWWGRGKKKVPAIKRTLVAAVPAIAPAYTAEQACANAIIGKRIVNPEGIAYL